MVPLDIFRPAGRACPCRPEPSTALPGIVIEGSLSRLSGCPKRPARRFRRNIALQEGRASLCLESENVPPRNRDRGILVQVVRMSKSANGAAWQEGSPHTRSRGRPRRLPIERPCPGCQDVQKIKPPTDKPCRPPPGGSSRSLPEIPIEGSLSRLSGCPSRPTVRFRPIDAPLVGPAGRSQGMPSNRRFRAGVFGRTIPRKGGRPNGRKWHPAGPR
jgi:hypothetical protein